MAKRFFDSGKFEDSWYRRLTPKFKCFWEYLLCKCNHAGIWKEDFELASFFIGEQIDREEALKVMNGRLIQLNEDTWFIPKYIKFQYDNKLNSRINAQLSVIKFLKSFSNNPTVAQVLTNCCPTVVDIDLDLDTDKDIVSFGKSENLFFKKVVDSWNVFCDKYPHLKKVSKLSNTRINKLKERELEDEFKDFETILKAAEEQVFLLNGTPEVNWTISFDWLIENDTNYLKVLERKYNDDRPDDPLAKYMRNTSKRKR